MNVVKHAGVSTASVEVQEESEQLNITVRDPGRGFEPSVLQQPPQAGERFGLSSVRERLVSCGGSVSIESSTGHETAVFLSIPLPDRESHAGLRAARSTRQDRVVKALPSSDQETLPCKSRNKPH